MLEVEAGKILSMEDLEPFLDAVRRSVKKGTRLTRLKVNKTLKERNLGDLMDFAKSVMYWFGKGKISWEQIDWLEDTYAPGKDIIPWGYLKRKLKEPEFRGKIPPTFMDRVFGSMGDAQLAAVLPLLQEALVGEYQQWDLYYSYKDRVAQPGIKEHFQEHAEDEAKHIALLQRHIIDMGGKPTTRREAIPQLGDNTFRAILSLQLYFEMKAVDMYKNILEFLDSTGPSGLKIDVEEILTEETEHAQELRLWLSESGDSLP